MATTAISLDHALDYAFVIFHAGIVLFNLVGWCWQWTRRLHLVVISLTLLSWFWLGLWFGWGYCPCTDWHWQVKARLGETELPSSYIKYYADVLTGMSWDPRLIDAITLVSTLSAFLLSCVLNWCDLRRRDGQVVT
jgi:hypothetical protein